MAFLSAVKVRIFHGNTSSSGIPALACQQQLLPSDAKMADNWFCGQIFPRLFLLILQFGYCASFLCLASVMHYLPVKFFRA